MPVLRMIWVSFSVLNLSSLIDVKGLLTEFSLLPSSEALLEELPVFNLLN